MSLRLLGLHTKALQPVNLELADGEVLVVCGPSGSGKTLLLRAIADLDPSEGEVEANGVRRDQVAGPQWRRMVRYVAAEPAWWTDHVGDHFRDAQAASLRARRLGLPDGCMTASVGRLSTGERQRLGFLRATEDRPPVLLLDEPTSSLDPRSEWEVETMLREMLDEGACVLIATHRAEQAKRLGGRRLLMDGGRPSPVQTWA